MAMETGSSGVRPRRGRLERGMESLERRRHHIESGESGEEEPGFATLSPPTPGPRSGCHPCSFEQLGLFRAQNLDILPGGHEIAAAWRLEGELNVDALERALNRVRERHEILRASFLMRSGEPVQVVDPMESLALDVTDVTGHGGEDCLRSVALFELRRRNPMRNGHPVRWHLLRCADQDHILLFRAHRAVFDRRSLTLFIRELESGYEDGPASEACSDEPPHLQYSDYARWQRTSLRGDALKEISTEWCRRLAHAGRRIDLPTVRRSRASGDPKRTWAREWITPSLRRRIADLADESGTEASAVHLAAFLTTVHRYTGRTDLTVGTSREGRTDESLRDLIGPFEGLLLLENDLSGDPSFRDLVRRVAKERTEVLRFGRLPARAALQDEPGGVLPEGEEPLPQLFFSLESSPPSAPRLDGLRVSTVELEMEARAWDLELVVVDDGPNPHLALGYDVRSLDRIPASRILRHVQNVLRRAVDDPERPLSRLSVLDEGERRRVVVEWARSHRHSSASPELLHEVVKHRMQRDDDRGMVHAGGGSAALGEVMARAADIARGLTERGVGPGSRVALCADRSVDAVAAILGILEAGGACVPLDPHGPPWTTCHVSDAISAELLLTTSRVGRLLPRDAEIEAVPVGRMEEEGASLAGPPSGHRASRRGDTGTGTSGNGAGPKRSVRGSDPAIVFCSWDDGGRLTSRVVPHRAAAAFLRSMADVPGLAPDDRFLAVSPFWSDHAILEIFLPLVCGGALVLAQDDEIGRPDRLLERIREDEITALQTTGAAWRALLEGAGWNGRKGLRAFCVGDPIDPDLGAGLLERADSVCTLYSPSGGTVGPLRHLLDPDDLYDDAVPLGRPVAAGRAYVLDGHDGPVPVGVPGELWVGGGEKHEEVVGPESGNGSGSQMRDPFADDGTWIRRTGMRARWCQDGSLARER